MIFADGRFSRRGLIPYAGGLLLVFSLWALLWAAPSLAGDIYEGKVERVVDGDTVQFLTDDYERVRVRLYGIDAPEKDQEGGARSLEALKGLIDGRRVTVDVLDVDRYSRLVGVIYLDGDSVNQEMVAQGQAWVYDSYCKSAAVCQKLRAAQNIAKGASLGVWANPSATPPWEHRRNKRSKKSN